MHVKSPLRALWKIAVNRAPVEAQLIVTRRCNLSCGYCSEYDKTSSEVPFDTLTGYIDALHRLGVVHISMLGGEPLLHSRLVDLVTYASRQSEVSVTTNGFLVSDRLITELNDSGLASMQVSIDTLNPDSALHIEKSMKTVAPKLERLRKLATFGVHVNVVLCEGSRDQFKGLLRALRKYGFFVTVNLLHGPRGDVEVGGQDYLELWDYHHDKGTPLSYVEYEYGRRLLNGERPDWTCRAGSRYLYVDEFGNVQFCSSQRGRLNKPILEYTVQDLQAHHQTKKGCESGCAIFCAYRASQLDDAPWDLAKAVFRGIRSGAALKSRHDGSSVPDEDSETEESRALA